MKFVLISESSDADVSGEKRLSTRQVALEYEDKLQGESGANDQLETSWRDTQWCLDTLLRAALDEMWSPCFSWSSAGEKSVSLAFGFVASQKVPGKRQAFELKEQTAGPERLPRPARRDRQIAHLLLPRGLCQARRAGCRLSAPGRCSQLHPSSGKEPLPRQVQLGSLAAEVYTDPAGSGGEKDLDPENLQRSLNGSCQDTDLTIWAVGDGISNQAASGKSLASEAALVTLEVPPYWNRS
ncbi:hypothetical protein E5288_WYG007742 [Bos mutus]|uniref:Uncharacterized protein n=1 Tax=Bos mutus TaxID=72004 RepID=A0A6B0R9U7_9CETA|nr:hypothetical protein [Bos mutus]